MTATNKITYTRQQLLDLRPREQTTNALDEQRIAESINPFKDNNNFLFWGTGRCKPQENSPFKDDEDPDNSAPPLNVVTNLS